MTKSGDKRIRRRSKRSLRSRLKAGSFLLSRMEALSARWDWSLRRGIAGRTLGNAERTERAFHSGAGAQMWHASRFSETVSAPIRKAVATGACESLLLSWATRLRRAFFHTRVRFFGIAGLVFSLYTAAIFFAEQYMAGGFGDANPMSLCTAAVLLPVSVLLLFCGAPLNEALAGSHVFSRILIGVLGAPPEAFRRGDEPAHARGGLAFVVGTAAGLATLLIPPHRVLLGLLATLFCLCIPATPEMGLLAAVMTLPFAPFSVTVVLTVWTAFGYGQKYLRYKRVFRFRVPEFLLVVSVAAFGLAAATTGDPAVLKQVAVYGALWFLAVNLMTTERLHHKLIAAILYGGLLTLLLSAADLLAARFAGGEALLRVILPNGPAASSEMLRLVLQVLADGVCVAAQGISAAAAALRIGVSGEVLGCYLLMMLPIALYHGKRRSGVLLVLLILVNALLLGSVWIWLGVLLGALLYAAFSHAAWTGATFCGACGLSAAVTWAGGRLGTLAGGFSAAAQALARKYAWMGIGSGDQALLAAALHDGLMPDGFACGLYTRLLLEGGIPLLLLVLAAALFALQRLFGSLRYAEVRGRRRMCGCIAAACLLFLAAGVATDVWADLRVLGLFWCLCAAAALTGDVYGFHEEKEAAEQWI